MTCRRSSVTVRDTLYTNKGHATKIHLFVYDTLEEMWQAADSSLGTKENWQTDEGKTLAITQSGDIYDFDDDGNETYNRSFFYVRFCKDHIGTEIVSHECAHLALRIFEHWFGKRASVRMKDEEPFAHLLSYTMASIVDKFYEKGYYET